MIHERIVNCLYEKDLDELDRLYATEDFIRCKDCKHGELTRNAVGDIAVICHNPDALWLEPICLRPDWYCADAEQK
jgi:hypothetical protein